MRHTTQASQYIAQYDLMERQNLLAIEELVKYLLLYDCIRIHTFIHLRLYIRIPINRYNTCGGLQE